MKTKALELYVHIPFCISKCKYCDFCSFQASEELICRYMEKLTEELRQWAVKLGHPGVPTVFVGGGTPSSVKKEHIERLCHVIFEEFLVSDDAEITIEANPGTVNPDKLLSYRKSGINRISFGLQTTIPEELSYLGRIHTYEEFYQGFQWAREAGFENINVDLMSAIPKQTIRSYEESLRKTAGLGPEHISAYSLIIEEGTPFYEDKYLEADLPSEDEEVRMYQMTGEILSEYGYQQYEVSNYAKKGYESLQNLGDWSSVTYLGVVLISSSYLEGKRFDHPSDMKEYLLTEDFCKVLETAPVLSVKEQMEEFMFLGLRKTQGVSKEAFGQQFSCTMASVYKDVINQSVKSGYMEETEAFLRLTKEGILISNQVLCEFLLSDETL